MCKWRLKYEDKTQISTNFWRVKTLIENPCVSSNFISLQRVTIQLSEYITCFAIHVLKKSGTSKIQHKYIIAAEKNVKRHLIGHWAALLCRDWPERKAKHAHTAHTRQQVHFKVTITGGLVLNYAPLVWSQPITDLECRNLWSYFEPLWYFASSWLF